MKRIPSRALIKLNGPDTLALLERTVTNTVKDWPAGAWRYGALLTPQGKIIADYLALRENEETVILDTHTDAAADLEKRLKLFRLRSKVEIGLEETRTSVLDEAATDPRSEALPGRKFASAGDVSDAAENWDARAIAANVPEWGRDYRAAEVFPTDINMDRLGGIDYKKGCFVGQEVASRMHRKGGVRKRTLIVKGEALTAGAAILAGEAPVGAVTSVAGDTGLALLRIDRLAKAGLETTKLTSNGAPVAIETGESDWANNEIAKFHAEA